MSWNAYLADLKTHATGCALISNEGAVCATEGTWKATPQESQQYALLFKNPAAAQASGLTYGGVKFFCNQATEEMIVAMKGKEAIVLQKSNTTVVAGYSDGSKTVPADLSAKVAKAVNQLLAVNY